MPNPLVARRKVLKFKQEAVPGTAENAGLSCINVYDFDVKPDVGFVAIPGQGGFGAAAAVATTRKASVTFGFDLTFKAAAEPLWMSLLPGCGYLLSSGTYVPTSKPPGDANGGKCITFEFNQDGRKQVVRGAMGNIVFDATAGGKVTAKASFIGILDTPTDAAMPVPSMPASETAALLASTPVFTMGASNMFPARVSLDLGAKVELVPSHSDASGFAHAVIADMQPGLTLELRAQPNGTYSPLSKMLSNAVEAFAWTIGAVGNGIAISAPKAQVRKAETRESGGILVDVGEYELLRSGAGGDDFLVFDPTP